MKPLFITDLDGTLLNEQGQLEEETVALWHRLSREGHFLSIATARSVASAGKILDALQPNIPVVLMNGVLLYHPAKKEFLRVETIPEQAEKEALRLFQEGGRCPYRFLFEGDGFSVEYRRLYHKVDEDFAAQRVPLYRRFEATEQYDEERRGVYLSAVDRYDILSPIVEKLQGVPGLSVAFYEDSYYEKMWFCECFSQSAGKANAALHLKEWVGADRLVAFGDNTNDIPLFEKADEGYAVENAVDSLKALSTAVIPSNRQQGVMRYLAERLL